MSEDQKERKFTLEELKHYARFCASYHSDELPPYAEMTTEELNIADPFVFDFVMSIDDARAQYKDVIGQHLVKQLRKNDFKAEYFPTGKEAADYALSFVKPGMSIGFGGSISLQEIGLYDSVRKAGGVPLIHSSTTIRCDEILEIQRKQLTCDLYISSSNGITRNGWLVNIDGTGNRVAALAFGPYKTIVIVSLNKLGGSVEECIDRIQNVACPILCRRGNRANPCRELGYCTDCNSEARICRVYQIMKRPPNRSDFTVVVVGESLGF